MDSTQFCYDYSTLVSSSKNPYQIKVEEKRAENSLTKFVINLDLKTGLRDDFA